MKHIWLAESRKNGIDIASNIKPYIVYRTYYEGDDIRFTVIHKDDMHKDDIGARFSRNIKLQIIVINSLCILLCLFSVLLAEKFHSPQYVVVTILFSHSILIDLSHALDAMHGMKSPNGSKYPLARFHAAEHMAINAYNDLKRIPTLKEVRRYSRFSKLCGSLTSLNRLCLNISFAILIWAYNNSTAYIIFLCLVILFVVIALKTKLFRFLQILYTSPPTDSELCLAIKALENFEFMEKMISLISSDGN